MRNSKCHRDGQLQYPADVDPQDLPRTKAELEQMTSEFSNKNIVLYSDSLQDLFVLKWQLLFTWNHLLITSVLKTAVRKS
jgi:hypothetical protein